MVYYVHCTIFGDIFLVPRSKYQMINANLLHKIYFVQWFSTPKYICSWKMLKYLTSFCQHISSNQANKQYFIPKLDDKWNSIFFSWDSCFSSFSFQSLWIVFVFVFFSLVYNGCVVYCWFMASGFILWYFLITLWYLQTLLSL